MRILLVHPGARISISDVYDGLADAFHAAGVEVVTYALDGRLEVAAHYLKLAWRRVGRANGMSPPTDADVAYLASSGILERALRHQVDWTLIVSGMYICPDFLVLMRRARQPVALLLTESPYDDELQARLLPFVECAWTNERGSVEYLRRFNSDVYYLPHAYDPAKHYPALSGPEDEPDVPAHDVVFVGTGFQERIELLEAVDWSGVDLGLYGTWTMLGSRSKLRRYVRGGPVPNRVAAALYRRAKVGLNLYRTSRGFGKRAPRIECAESLNPRALELAACGVFTLSDYRAEVAEVFGELVPTFRSPEELGRLVRRWLADDEGRRAIAARLPAAVEGRTFDAMAEQVIEMLGARQLIGAR